MSKTAKETLKIRTLGWLAAFCWILAFLILATPSILAAMPELDVISQTSDHLAKRDLTYAALFVAACAIALSVFLVKELIKSFGQSRTDFVNATQRFDRVADAIESIPCAEKIRSQTARIRES